MSYLYLEPYLILFLEFSFLSSLLSFLSLEFSDEISLEFSDEISLEFLISLFNSDLDEFIIVTLQPPAPPESGS